jgi:plasmid rolling circle replication initiator protein Rep
MKISKEELEKLPLIDTGEALEDISSTGKKRDWDGHKKDNEKLVALYEKIEECNGLVTKETIFRVYMCGRVLGFLEDAKQRKRLFHAIFCRNRFCKMCNWRRSLKMYGQISMITDKMMEDKKVEFLFLTLTIKNVTGEKLAETITKLIKAFSYIVSKHQTFAPSKKLKKSLLGGMRALEITYNSDAKTYHPHIHAILAVKPSYFKKDYVTKDEIIEMWKEALHVDYDPSIDIRKIDRNAKAIAEVAKYPIKTSDVFDLGDDEAIEVMSCLIAATYKRRMVDFYGDFREYKRKLKLDDVEDGDLIHVDDDTTSFNPIAIKFYGWDGKVGTYISCKKYF